MMPDPLLLAATYLAPIYMPLLVLGVYALLGRLPNPTTTTEENHR